MGSLTVEDLNELTTEVLDPPRWWATLAGLVAFLGREGVRSVRLEHGFVLQRDLAGLPQGADRVVALDALVEAVQAGLDEGTIERVGSSDFVFRALERPVSVMLCNDADIHVGSTDIALLERAGDVLQANAVRVYGPHPPKPRATPPSSVP